MIRKDKREHFKKEFDDNIGNEKRTWQTIGKLIFNRDVKDQHISKIKQNSIEFTNSEEIATVFNNYFSNVCSNILQGNLTNFQDRHIFNDFYFVEITEIQVANYINNLKNNCSQGLDQISTKLIKTHKETIIPILTKLINNVTFSAIFPNELKIAKVIPIYKSKDSTNVANYRPISVLPVL